MPVAWHNTTVMSNKPRSLLRASSTDKPEVWFLITFPHFSNTQKKKISFVKPNEKLNNTAVDNRQPL